MTDDRLKANLSEAQKSILNLIEDRRIQELLNEYNWDLIYTSIKTFEVLGLVHFKNKQINYPQQLLDEFSQAELKNMIRINDVNDIKLEIGDRLCDYDDGYICDVIAEISDNEVDIYYSDLFEWVKHNWEYVDEACSEFGMPNYNDSNIIIKLIQQAQFYKNEQDLYNELDEAMLNYCYNYIKYDLGIEEITEEQNEQIEEKCTNVDNNDQLEDFREFIEELLAVEEVEA